jgi:hypothetical protein
MRPTKRNKRRGSREAECIPSKASFEAAIQLEVKSDTKKELAEVNDKEKEQEREQRIRMYRIESPFRSLYSVGSDCDTVG